MRKELEDLLASGKDISIKDIEEMFESQQEFEEFVYEYGKQASKSKVEIPELSTKEEEKYLCLLICCHPIDTVAMQLCGKMGYKQANNILERLVIDGYLIKQERENQRALYTIKEPDKVWEMYDQREKAEYEKFMQEEKENNPEEPIIQINETGVSMEEVLQKYAPRDIIKKGEIFFCICPFKNHVEKTPSFSFRKDSYRCFGCSSNGNVVGFVSKLFDITAEDAEKKIKVDFSVN